MKQEKQKLDTTFSSLYKKILNGKEPPKVEIENMQKLIKTSYRNIE